VFAALEASRIFLVGLLPQNAFAEFSGSSRGRAQINGGVNFIVEGRVILCDWISRGTIYASISLKETVLRCCRNACHHYGIMIAVHEDTVFFELLLLGEIHVRTD